MNRTGRAAILAALIAITLGFAWGAPGTPPVWLTKTSESDVEDTVVYETKSDFGGKHYDSVIYGRDLKGAGTWKDGQDLAITPAKIRSTAQGAFQKQFPQFRNFKVSSINLIHLSLLDDWIVDVVFDGTDYAVADSGSIHEKNIHILVLLNGRVITPTESVQ